MNRKTIPKNACSQIVAAQFTTRAGRELHGFVVVASANDRATIQSGAVLVPGFRVVPTVLSKTASRREWRWSGAERSELLDALSSNEGDVFPMCYRLKAAISGEKVLREGQIA